MALLPSEPLPGSVSTESAQHTGCVGTSRPPQGVQPRKGKRLHVVDNAQDFLE